MSRTPEEARIKKLEERIEDFRVGIEEANDKLAEGLEKAQLTAKGGGMRPSTMMAFDAMQEAHEILSMYDHTREDP